MRILAWFAGSFAAGIFLAQYLLPEDWLLPCAVVFLVLSCGRLLLPKEAGRRVLLIGVGLSFAFGWNWLYIRQVQQPAEALVGTEQSVVMTLCDYAVPTDYGAKATVRIDGLSGKAVYYGDEALLELEPGQTVSGIVQMKSAAHIRDDDVTAFTSKGIFLLLYNSGDMTYGEGTAASPRWWPVRVGQEMRGMLNGLFEGDVAAFMTAILTGDKSGLSLEAEHHLSGAGLYHILAVSGLHCGYLLAIVVVLTGRHRLRLKALCTLPLLAFYVLLTGGSPSVLRACMMLVFLLAAPLFRRESDPPTALLFALLLILLANPFAAASISLQLSFGAVTGILFLTPRLYQLLIRNKKLGKVFCFTAAGFSTTMGALLFTAPLSGYYFGSLVLISPLSNFLCLWAASAVFVLGLVTVALGFLAPPLASIVGVIPTVLVRYILTASEMLTEVPYHAVYFDNPYLKYWLILTYSLFILVFLRKGTGKNYLLAAGLAGLALCITIGVGERRFSSRLDAVVLDVGQGQCVLLKSGEEFALVDCGSANSWYHPGQDAGQYLRSLGCRKLDYLILTHFDADHINGVEALFARIDVECLLVPETNGLTALLAERGTEVEVLTESRKTTFGQGLLTILPPVSQAEDDNERGLTVLVSAGANDLLITGDMSSAAERVLAEQYSLPDIEVLVAGHHGSITSTSKELLNALKPEAVCISVGSNSYGHPDNEVLRRIAEHCCEIYRTDMQGHIHLSLN